MAGTTPVTSRGGGSEARRTAVGPMCVGDEVEELQKLWHAFSLAPCLEHVVCKMELIVFPPCCTARGKP
jgi:hypothetical protein